MAEESRKEERSLRDQLDRAKRELQRAHKTVRELQEEQPTIVAAAQAEVEKQFSDELSRLQFDLRNAENEISGLKEQIEKLDLENANYKNSLNQLQAQVFHIDRGVNPLRNEEYYTHKFENIKVDFEMWVARHALSSSESISKTTDATIRSTIARLGPCGRAAAEFFQKRLGIKALFSETRTRIQLIRHLGALLLFELVLEPFVFGLSPQISQAFSWIDADIMTNGCKESADGADL